MLRTLEMIGHSQGGILPYTVIPTFFDRRTRASMDALRAMRDQHGDHLWTRMIPVDTQFREASRAGKPISIYNPNARGNEAYASLLRWLQQVSSPLAEAASQ